MMKEPKLQEIQRVVAEWGRVPVERLTSMDRSKPVVDYRVIAMYLARRLTSQSYTVIGRHFRRDHTTVMHAVDLVSGREDLLRMAQAIEQEIIEAINLPGVFPWRSGPEDHGGAQHGVRNSEQPGHDCAALALAGADLPTAEDVRGILAVPKHSG